MKRNPTIDILRGIAIFLVVFGHISHIGWTKTYIWGFHIPIFSSSLVCSLMKTNIIA